MCEKGIKICTRFEVKSNNKLWAWSIQKNQRNKNKVNIWQDLSKALKFKSTQKAKEKEAEAFSSLNGSHNPENRVD